jgi:putative sterol carrier protein
MGYPFPSEEWLNAVVIKLNTDEKYAKTAKNWEGDLVFKVVPDDETTGEKSILYYMDLWHGTCRNHIILKSHEDKPNAKFIFELPRAQAIKILEGELDPVGAMVTRKLKVRGNIGYMLRNVPVVLDFIRVCKLVEIED